MSARITNLLPFRLKPFRLKFRLIASLFLCLWLLPSFAVADVGDTQSPSTGPLAVLSSDLSRVIPHNPNENSNFVSLGTALVEEQADAVETFYLLNQGHAKVKIYGVENTHLTTLDRISIDDIPAEFVLNPGEMRPFKVIAPHQIHSIQKGRISIRFNARNNPSTSSQSSNPYEFNVAAAFGSRPYLACGADSNSGVADDFSCDGRVNGTICGDNGYGLTKVCLQESCTLLGDVNGDGTVDFGDVSPFYTDVMGAQQRLAADLICSGQPNASEANMRAFADALVLAGNPKEFNTKMRENCGLSELELSTRGFGMAWTQEPIQLLPGMEIGGVDNYGYPDQVEVCIDNLGFYSLETGEWTADNYYSTVNAYIPKGKYLLGVSVPASPIIPQFDGGPENDFRVNYLGDDNITPRAAHLNAAAIAKYFHITNFRNLVLNDSFIRDLKLDPEIEKNLIIRQFRAGGLEGFDGPSAIPLVQSNETNIVGPTIIFPGSNAIWTPLHTRGFSGTGIIPRAFGYDPAFIVGEYSGLATQWVTGTNTVFPGDALCKSQFPQNITACLNDAIEYFTGAIYLNKSHVQQTAFWTARHWAEFPCGHTTAPLCDQGIDIDNIMFHEEGNNSGDQIFPFTSVAPNMSAGNNGPSSERPSIFFAGLFYDIAFEAGLGWRKAHKMFWKTLSLITQPTGVTMRNFGELVMQAAAQLFPNESGEGSIYDDVIGDTLSARGIVYNGADSIRDNLPPPVGAPENFPDFYNDIARFGSLHPDKQLALNTAYSWGDLRIFLNTYIHDSGDYEYTSLNTYKNSKHGPCDKLMFSDGTFFPLPNPIDIAGQYQGDGTYLASLRKRELGNRSILIPGAQVQYAHYRKRCSSQMVHEYSDVPEPWYIDVHPFGWKIIQVMPNGFSYTVNRLSETPDYIRYELSIEDPSLTMVGGARTGPATYAWELSDPKGLSQSSSGMKAVVNAKRNEPLTIKVTRTRGAIVDVLERTDRGNDLDRDAGRAFVTNCLEPDPDTQDCK